MSGPADDTPEPRNPRSGRIALLLAVVALAAIAAQWLGLDRSFRPVATTTDELARVQQQATTLQDQLRRLRGDVDRLLARAGETGVDAGELAARLGALEAARTEAAGGNQGRRLWLASQATHFLQLANAQARLAHDSRGALAALEAADDYLREAEDPRLLPVRRLISSEQAALRAVGTVDTAGLSLQLDTLAEQIRDLPLRQPPDAFKPQAAPAPEGMGGGARALQVLRNAFSSVVSVRRTEEPPAPLPEAGAAGLVAQSLGLELQLARLALLRGETDILRRSLAAVRGQLLHYYDTQGGAGAAALASLDAISGGVLAEQIPDISGSLAELTRLQELEARP